MFTDVLPSLTAAMATGAWTFWAQAASSDIANRGGRVRKKRMGDPRSAMAGEAGESERPIAAAPEFCRLAGVRHRAAPSPRSGAVDRLRMFSRPLGKGASRWRKRLILLLSRRAGPGGLDGRQAPSLGLRSEG